MQNEYFKLVSLLVQARPEAQAPRLQDEALAEIADSPGEAAAMQSLEQGLREDLASGEAAFTTTGGSGRFKPLCSLSACWTQLQLARAKQRSEDPIWLGLELI